MVSTDSTWTKLCTYTTVKKCQIVDAKNRAVAQSRDAGRADVHRRQPHRVARVHETGGPERRGQRVRGRGGLLRARRDARGGPARVLRQPGHGLHVLRFVDARTTRAIFAAPGRPLAKTESAVFITTYFQDTPVDSVSANAAGLYSSNAFVPGVDQMRLVWDHQVSTSWGEAANNPAIEFRPGRGRRRRARTRA